MKVNPMKACQCFYMDILDVLRRISNMDIDYQRIGRHLRAARKRKGLTQAEVSEILNIAENTYSNMERGKQKPSLTRIIQLCSVYGISPGCVLDDCSDALINCQAFEEEENVDKKELHLLINKCSDNTAHILNIAAQALYREIDLR